LSVTPDVDSPGRGDAGSPSDSDATAGAKKERWPKVVGVIAAACLIAFVAYAVTSANKNKAAPAVVTVSQGKLAPGFDLPNLDGGAKVSLASFRGKPTIVNFFASWCQNCRQELDAFAAVSATSKGKINFVGVDTDETSATTARKLLASAGDTYPVGVDPNGNVATGKYYVSGLPVTYFLNAQGRVVGEAFGAQGKAGLDRWITTLEKASSSSR
jgi:cytochrome c biogenesis protein CcmG/thiol:disulfide interchange protein DsbE